MKGQKICPQCSKGCGPRSYQCSCGHAFIFNPNGVKNVGVKVKRFQPVKIEDLVRGDVLRVKPGSYYETKEGSKYSMGEKGVFTFVKHAPNGIMATSKKLGYIFLYTGPAVDDSITGTHIRPHRIKKVIKK